MIVATNEQLFQLTEKDLRTLLIEPFFGSRPLALAVGDVIAAVDVEIPQDRVCIAETLLFQTGTEAATTWVLVTVKWRPSNTPTTQGTTIAERRAALGLVPDGGGNAPPLANGGSYNLIDRHLTLPPGGILRFSAQRTGTTGATTATAFFTCFLVPAGNMGRVS